MIPARILRKLSRTPEGDDLDVLLARLYTTFRDSSYTHHAGSRRRIWEKLTAEERVARFGEWLESYMTEQNPLEAARIQDIFARELPLLRSAWREATAKLEDGASG